VPPEGDVLAGVGLGGVVVAAVGGVEVGVADVVDAVGGAEEGAPVWLEVDEQAARATVTSATNRPHTSGEMGRRARLG
jgi:hypothetical protein